jgi:hypothetical protein
MRKLLQFLFLIMISQAAWSATYTAASCSSSAVTAAINSAVNGDTVLVPAGSCSWSATISTSKAISILACGSPDYPGGCTGTTTITNNANPIIQISNTGSNFVRVSGFTVNSPIGDSSTTAMEVFGPATKFRIDNNTFNGGDCPICTNYFSNIGAGIVAGVVDHNTIKNSGRGYFAQDGRTKDGGNPGSVAWSEFLGHEITFACSNNPDKIVYFEDNTITWNQSVPTGYGQGTLYGQYGAKVVYRHNTLSNFSPLIDAHGDAPGYGTVFYEIYDNIIDEGGCKFTGFGCEGKMMYLRGGQHLIHDNTFRGTDIPIEFTVYSSSDMSTHRIHNTFVWNNTWCQDATNNACTTDQTKMADVAGDTQGALTQGSNYWLRAPQSGDVYFPYTPYTYPHPLTQLQTQGGGGTPPSPPSGLSAVVQ